MRFSFPVIRWALGLWILLCIGGLRPVGLEAAPEEYERLKANAEARIAEGSFAKAHALYAQTNALSLRTKDRRWVDFRLADTRWRAQAQTKTPDPTAFENSRRQLEVLIRDTLRQEDKDRVWAEVQESLGDFWWLRAGSKNWGAGWRHYQQALDWWAGAKDIEQARKRYLGMMWNMARPHWREPHYYYGYYGNMLPVEVAQNALRIAQAKKDKVRAHYLLAMTLRNQGGWNQQKKVTEHFEAVLAAGKSFEWYDDALFQFAEWLGSRGEVVVLKNGQRRQEPDHVRALAMYRRIVREFSKGETRHFDPAKRRIEDITRPVLGISVANVFVPGSKMQVHLNWRNIEKVALSLYPVDLSRDVHFEDKRGAHEWTRQINLRLLSKLTSFSEDTGDDGKHKPGQKILPLETELEPGAYILEATGGGERARDLVLVTDSALVLKSSGTQAVLYFCDAFDGGPIENASVSLWERHYTGRKWVWKRHTAATDAHGLAVFDLKETRNREELFAAARSESRQAFALGTSYSHHSNKDSWKLYAFTDRPAYRPGETAQWKVIARTYDGEVYSTPAGDSVTYEITDPRGTKVKEGTLKLNAFGSAADTLELTASMVLGSYQVSFRDGKKKRHIGSAPLFALEEYKLPEFQVRVRTPEEDGKKKTFLLGDTVEVEIEAEYYFGGPVANANVEVFVSSRPFHPSWRPPREFPWYYEDTRPRRHWGGRGRQVKREVLKTGPDGRARLSFETGAGTQDLEYTVEARVTDASRREITASDTLRVTQQRYYIYLNPEHNIYRPQDKVQIPIQALDANDQPVQAKGLVRVQRDFWFEIWIDPAGREVQGQALKAAREAARVFPPPPPVAGGPAWRLKFQGYQHEEILTRTVATNAEGKGEFSFTPEREGYYRILFSGEEEVRPPIQAETTVWIADHNTAHLDLRPGRLEILVDKDTVRSGQKTPVMLVAPASGAHVLFSVEGDELYSHRLVKLDGAVKLIELDIEEKHVPNIFLSAVMVNDREIFQDVEQVIVPPVKQFLEVTVATDRDTYEPREEATLTVTTKDHAGHPVAAEVALGLVDASVYAIRKDPAPDPRPFFYGAKRNRRPVTQSTFQQKRYIELVEGEQGALIDRRLAGNKEAGRRDREAFGQLAGGLADNALGKSRQAAAPVSESRMELAAKRSADEAPMAQEMDAAAGEGGPAVQVRSDFRATALWEPHLMTGSDGRAVVKVKFPDSLTQWKATARAATGGNHFGVGDRTARTRKPLTVRLQVPRFFVVGDSLTLSALINNNTNQEMTVRPALKLEGLSVSARLQNGTRMNKDAPVTIPASGEARVDWYVAAQRPGEARVRVTAKSSTHADAMEKSYPVHPHGVDKLIAKSGKMKEADLTVGFEIPKDRDKKSTELKVHVSPSIAVTMLDSLPYLIDYPYGCTEQTMSRFLPAVITAKTLTELGLQPEAVGRRIFGGIDPETAKQTHTKGRKDLKALDEMVRQGLKRLYDFQHADGGWGWWKEGESDPFMSAYVLWGLALAQGAGVAVDAGALARGADFLDKALVEAETRPDLQAWMLHALATHHRLGKKKAPGKFQAKALENLWTHRSRLSAYGRALFALSAHHYGEADKARVLVDNLENGVMLDQTPDRSVIQRGEKKVQPWILKTAHWGEDGIFRRWSEGGVEATAFALQALLAVDPKHPLVPPVMNWLVKNRRGSHWSNTRDTAIVVLTLNDYLRASKELSAQMEYELQLNGHAIARTRIEDVLSAPSEYRIDRRFLQDGANQLHILRKKGDGPLYFSVEARFFSLEEPVSPAGNEFFLHRQYHQLVGQPTLLKGYVFERVPVEEDGSVTSGARIETVITLEAKNNYEYLIIEDLKPAGFEAVQVRSGDPLVAKELKSSAVDHKFPAAGSASEAAREILSPHPEDPEDYTGRTLTVYQELRDRKTALFIDKLPQGLWEIRYTLRAEVPGEFHALPVLGHAMYIPEIRANGREIRLSIQERGD